MVLIRHFNHELDPINIHTEMCIAKMLQLKQHHKGFISNHFALFTGLKNRYILD